MKACWTYAFRERGEEKREERTSLPNGQLPKSCESLSNRPPTSRVSTICPLGPIFLLPETRVHLAGLPPTRTLSPTWQSVSFILFSSHSAIATGSLWAKRSRCLTCRILNGIRRSGCALFARLSSSRRRITRLSVPSVSFLKRGVRSNTRSIFKSELCNHQSRKRGTSRTENAR